MKKWNLTIGTQLIRNAASVMTGRRIELKVSGRTVTRKDAEGNDVLCNTAIIRSVNEDGSSATAGIYVVTESAVDQVESVIFARDQFYSVFNALSAFAGDIVLEQTESGQAAFCNVATGSRLMLPVYQEQKAGASMVRVMADGSKGRRDYIEVNVPAAILAARLQQVQAVQSICMALEGSSLHLYGIASRGAMAVSATMGVALTATGPFEAMLQEQEGTKILGKCLSFGLSPFAGKALTCAKEGNVRIRIATEVGKDGGLAEIFSNDISVVALIAKPDGTKKEVSYEQMFKLRSQFQTPTGKIMAGLEELRNNMNLLDAQSKLQTIKGGNPVHMALGEDALQLFLADGSTCMVKAKADGKLEALGTKGEFGNISSELMMKCLTALHGDILVLGVHQRKGAEGFASYLTFRVGKNVNASITWDTNLWMMQAGVNCMTQSEEAKTETKASGEE